jgi:demethylmenaquinone methyltransferase/2-methoxy-6-polyprenyl-1,4-benzoquinol methylase
MPSSVTTSETATEPPLGAERRAVTGIGPPGDLPEGLEKVAVVRAMFDTIAPRYELLNAIMSLGMGSAWRRRCVARLELPAGSRVLDVACGTGDLCRELTRQAMLPVGLDLSRGMLGEAGAGRRTRAPLVLGDALKAPFASASFDGAVSGFALRNVCDLRAMFAELSRLLRPRGRVSLLDLSEPEGRLLKLGHRLWCNYAVPLFGSLLSDRSAYRYLPRSLAYLPAPEVIASLLEEEGFVGVEHEVLSGGISQLYVASRAGRGA